MFSFASWATRLFFTRSRFDDVVDLANWGFTRVKRFKFNAKPSSVKLPICSYHNRWNLEQHIHQVVAVLFKVTEVRSPASTNLASLNISCATLVIYKIPQPLFIDRRGKRKKIERRNTTKSEQKWEEIARGENCFFFPTNKTRSAHSVRDRRRARSRSLDYKQATKLLIAVNLCPPLLQNL